MAEGRENQRERASMPVQEHAPSPETRETPEQPAVPEREAEPGQAEAAREAALGAKVPERPAGAIPRERFRKEIEDILSDGLKDLYLGLPEDKREAFRKKGEETAESVREILSKPKIKAKAVLDLVIDWLERIPDTNPFFLEQEAKIKTDKLLTLADEERRRAAESIA